jgi:D-tyrosyl-tRNA(Tyr) deacylase
MRALIQRVSEAIVTVDNAEIGKIPRGLLIFLGITHSDTPADAALLADKISHLRIFENEKSQFDRSLLDVKGQALVVSQFTLYADTQKGRRPSFIDAARPEIAEPLCNQFVEALQAQGIDTHTGQFQAHMMVTLINDGPVTIMLDTKE